MRRLLAAAAAALLALALAGCGGSDESVEVTGFGGRGGPDSDPGQNVGEVFADGPCEGWQDIEGAVIRYTFAYGEDSGVPWVSDERVAGDYEYQAAIDFEEDGETCVGSFTGTETMTNDGGTWQGTVEATMTGTGDADTPGEAWVYDINGTLLGSGDYDGLTYTYNLYGADDPWELTGTISPA